MDYNDVVGDAYMLVTTDRDSLPEHIDIELVDSVATYLTTVALSRFAEESEDLPDTPDGQEEGERILSQKIEQAIAAAYVLAKIDGIGDQPTNPLTNRVVQELLARGEVHLSIQVD